MSSTQIGTCTQRTVSRWHQPDTWGVWAALDSQAADPGPYREGETVPCRCGSTVAVTHRTTTRRETGTQYIGDLSAH